MKTPENQPLVINIHLSRGLFIALSLGLFVIALLGYLTWGHTDAAAAVPRSPAAVNMRQFYVTPSTYNGSEALTACASGYHMASLWEVLDPSNLAYNTTLGRTKDDSGAGPPTWEIAVDSGWWVRTGSASSDSAGSPGTANCNNWTASGAFSYGTLATLPEDWTVWENGSPVSFIYVFGPWEVTSCGCDEMNPVICIED